MGLNVSIRRAGANDAVGIAHVFLAARATMRYLPHLHTEADTRAFIARGASEWETTVAVDGECIAGFMALRENWLEHLYVHPAHFNVGIGTQLLEQARLSQPAGFQFWVFWENTGAQRFYQRNGCVSVEFTDGSRNEERLPDVRYVRRRVSLGPRASCAQ